ncbi:phage tail protein [Planomicrobium okeanokoites]|uniref:Phage tail protein n=1 Tax=Planomicrobium okeanokoites TaxID=244 RepID=A0ABV7KTC2_PLAOK|nr:phage tail protein [Planomicrobium okeanokoites]TAA71589.1 hypothetical protein D2910_04740 [Planomicrobium okeanokoites]
MYVRDLEGNEYPLEATVTHDFELNGKPVLSFVAKPSKVNDVFLKELSEMWQVIDFDDVVHRIEYARKRGEGDRLSVDVKATPSFYDDFAVSRIYMRYDQHMTAAEAFGLIFADTDYNYVLVDPFYAVQWQGFGDGQTRLETFKRALERYKAEFRIVRNTVYIEQQIGVDTSFMYRYRLNASNIVQEIDASNLWTYARGYGDFAEGEEDNAALIREYYSPLASVAGIGKRDAPPYYNGSITTVETMDEAIKESVDNSLKISISTDVHDLRKQGYPLAHPNLGDRVYLTDERIGFDEEVRIYQMTIVRDWQGNVLDLKLVIGSPGLVKRHQAQLSQAVDRITDLINGNLPIPFNVLPNAVRLASDALKSALTELAFDNGIVATDPNDPNRLVVFNSAGVGISLDGGVTFDEAVTYLGINTSLLTAGDIHTNNIRIVGDSNFFFWDGTGLQAIDPTDVTRFVRLRSDGLYISKGAITIERPDGYKTINNGMSTFDVNIQGVEPMFFSPAVTLVQKSYAQWLSTRTASASVDFNQYSFKHEARYLKVRFRVLASGSNTAHFEIWKGGEKVASAQTSVSNDSDPSVQNGSTLTVDLGVPTGNSDTFQIRFRTSVSNEDAYAMVTRKWLEG